MCGRTTTLGGSADVDVGTAMDVTHRAMASPVGRRLSSFASARASFSSARRTRSADPGFPFWLAPHAAPVRSTGRRDHAFTSMITTTSARQRRTKATGLRICCVCGAELLALGHSGVASLCCPCFFFGRGPYGRRRLHVSYLAYVLAGRLDFLSIWPLYVTWD